MRIHLPISFLLIVTCNFSFAQDLTGTWHGFQISRDKGHYQEYRITVDLKLVDDNVSGTMQLKSPLKGVITTTFTGKLDKKENLLYLKEDEIITEGVGAKDATLCSYILSVGKNSLKGKGRSRFKGYDHLTLRLQRGANY
ncbi:MAG TPA: hypothetical protein VGD17_00785 [Chitinophagaceae bacterium]